MISIFDWFIRPVYSIKQTFSVNLKINIIALLMAIPCSVGAIDSDQWQAVELNMEDGLPDSTVYSMAQDASGYMWFGTTSGLARYDGYSFKVYRHDGADENTLSNNNAGNIYLDSTNRLWIGTFGGGANVMDLNNGEILRYPYSNSNTKEMIAENVQTFFEDSHGNMWIGTSIGLYQLSDQTISYYGQKSGNGNEKNQSRVWDIEEDSKGYIWLATSDGLTRFNVEKGEISYFKLPQELISNISSNQFRTLQIIDDVLWIGSSTGLFSFKIDSETFEFHHHNNKNIKINDIHVQEDGGLLIASMQGLYEFNPSDNTFKTNENNELWQLYSHLDVRHIQRDRSGLLWLATRVNGVVKVDQTGSLFQLHTDYASETDLKEKNQQVWTIHTDKSKRLLIGTSGTLYKQTVAGDFKQVTLDGMEKIPGIIRTIKASATGGHWIGSSTGLYYLHQDTYQVEIKNNAFKMVGIDPTDIFSVFESKSGVIWLTLYNMGIMSWDPDQQKAELIQSIDGYSLTDLNIGVIYADVNQHLWIGSNLAGVFKYDTENQQIEVYSNEYGNNHSLSSNRVKDIFQDSAGRIWVGTANGLNQFMPETQNFKQFNQSDGLLSDSITAIFEDSKQNLWISYKFGVSRFNPAKQEISNYVLNEAISNDGFITRSSIISGDDVMYFGSVDGYYSFDPKMLVQNSQYQPQLRMNQVWVNDQPLTNSQWGTKQNEFDLYNGDRSIAFEFAALDYKSPEQIKYLYRIFGLNEEWLNISSNRLIELNHLNPGEYQIVIKAINNDGRWSEQQMSVNLNIHPEWWNRGWVWVIFAVLVIILAICFHQFRTHKIRKLNLRLENEVKIRTSELYDLNTQLKTAAHSDYLTNLPNRMAFIKAVEEKHQQGIGDGDCVVMADIDFFKQINDKYGHAAGDLILVKVGELMYEMISEDDLIARWGGEEFIFYFEGKGVEQILPMIDGIRESIEKAQFKYAKNIIPVTLTFGICQSQHGMSLNDCIIKADEAMFEGKSQGRNTVKIADQTKAE